MFALHRQRRFDFFIQSPVKSHNNNAAMHLVHVAQRGNSSSARGVLYNYLTQS